MTILAYTDGASKGNPGESGIGVILKDTNNNILKTLYGHIGKTTNNIAEYKALIACIKLVNKMDCDNLIVHSDSELLTKQLLGEYKVRNNNLKKYYSEVLKLLAKSRYSFTIKHILREENKEADRLANLGIKSKKRIEI